MVMPASLFLRILEEINQVLKTAQNVLLSTQTNRNSMLHRSAWIQYQNNGHSLIRKAFGWNVEFSFFQEESINLELFYWIILAVLLSTRMYVWSWLPSIPHPWFTEYLCHEMMSSFYSTLFFIIIQNYASNLNSPETKTEVGMFIFSLPVILISSEGNINPGEVVVLITATPNTKIIENLLIEIEIFTIKIGRIHTMGNFVSTTSV